MVKNLFLFIFIYSLLLTSCMKERKHTNPFDPLVNITTSPTGLTLEQTSVTSIKLSWNDTYDGETGYRIDRKVGNGEWQQRYAEIPHNTKIYNDISTQPLQTYYYKVSACYDKNYSLPISGNLTTNFPAPSNIVLEQTSVSTIKLTWLDNSIGEEGFVIDRKVGTEDWVMNYASVAADTVRFIDNGLSLGTTYAYRVKAKSGEIYSAAIEASLTLSFPAPSNLVLIQTGATSISLHWQDNTTWEETYIIDRKTNSGNWIINYASANVNAVQLTDSAVFLDSMYTYRIKAKAGTVFSNSVESVLTATFPAPSNLVLTQIGATSVRLQWQDNCTWEDGFIIDRKVGTGNWVTSYTSVHTNVSQFSDTGLTLGIIYTYRVRAFSGQLFSNYSTEVGWILMPVSFVLVNGGTFNNGTSDVTVSSFFIDKYELTQNEYQTFMGSNPSNFPLVMDGPVEEVSWFNSIEYCNRRSINEGLTPCYGYSSYGTNPATWPEGWSSDSNNHTNVSCNWTVNGYRLPTEAEWEFAARGGNETNNYNYSGSNDLDIVAWYGDETGGSTHTVGTKIANELGIYDMSGNVWEWCWDIYDNYPSGAQNNPHGAASGSARVFRGGSWANDAYYCLVSTRYSYAVTGINNNLGFRVCRNAP